MDEEFAKQLKGLKLSEIPKLKCQSSDCFVCVERQHNFSDVETGYSYYRQPGIFFDEYDKLEVCISGLNIKDLPKPILGFEFIKELPPSIFDVQFYKKPTPVQKSAIPLMMEGLDLVVCAQTGSGKTAAFLIPIIAKVLSKPRTEKPYALILTPTRELAIQIHRDAVKLTKETHIKCCCAYGGKYITENINDISAGCDLLIATPGRILHLCRSIKDLLSKVQTFVLDEADHILGNNFVNDLNDLKNILPPIKKRQTVLVSASIPGQFEKAVYGPNICEYIKSDFKEVLKEFLKDDYIFVCVGRVGGTLNFIDQSFFKVEPDTPKLKILTDILNKESKQNKKTIVFLETKEDAAAMAMFLCSCGFQVTVFHNNRCQNDREYALHQFNTGVKPIMICTSVSARGLDIVEVKTVINYDLPYDISTYLYRIGRTGRAGHAGKAISFFVKGRDDGIARGLVKNLSMSNQDVPEWLDDIAETAYGTDFGPRGGIYAAKDTRYNVLSKVFKVL
ncbi:probable ATP-dependent RNA helicase DDX4 isoform X2 [Hydra vulgaris]|uniref:RNA helicase n=1 Tax=Hydra vulgaris TaxID=6087 RepID=A0ABM4BCN3_HYDVU